MPEFSLITIGGVLLNSQLQVETLPIEIKAEGRAFLAQYIRSLILSLLVRRH